MNIGAYLMTTAPHHDNRCKLIEETWGTNISDSDELFFFTDKEDSRVECADKEPLWLPANNCWKDDPARGWNRATFPPKRCWDRYIKVTDDQHYNSHTTKCIKSIYFAQKRENIDWFYIGADDNYLYVNTLKKFCSEQDTNKPLCFGAVSNTFGNDKSLYYPLLGAGYVLNKKGIDNLVKHYPDMLEDYKQNRSGDARYDWIDVYLGYAFKETDIEVIKTNHLMFTQPYGHYHRTKNLDISDLSKYISFHYITSEEKFGHLFSHEH